MGIKFIFIVVLLLSCAGAMAQDFVYTPKNPAFGGNPYNYSWMMSSAQAQDTYKAPETASSQPGYTRDPAQDFAESLNRQILSRLSREIVTRQFGEEALDEGTYVLGDYMIEIGNASDGININIVDNKTGATTQVSVPFF